MGKNFTLARLVPQYSAEVQRTKQKMVKGSGPHVGAAAVAGPLIAVAIVAAFCAYVYQANSSSTSGYVSSSIQSQIADSDNQYQALEVQAAQLESLQRIESDPAVASMVPVDTISYIQTGDVAIR
jgi:hypothetical protein